MQNFLAGMMAEAKKYKNYGDASTISSSGPIDEKFVKNFGVILNLQQNLREAYDSYIPNIHVINIQNLAKILINNIGNYGDKYISFKEKIEVETNPVSTAPVSSIFGMGAIAQQKVASTKVKKITPKQIQAAIKDLQANLADPANKEKLENLLKEKISSYHKSILSLKNPINELNTLSGKIGTAISNISNGTIKNPNEVAAQLGAQFKQQIDTVFKNRNIIGVDDPELGSNDDTFVFFGESFDIMKPAINKQIADATIEYFNSVVKGIIDKVTPGYVANFGHAMVLSIDNGKEVSRFVNTPGIASTIYGIAAAGASPQTVQNAAVQYREESGLITNTIEFNKNFTTKAGILMQLGITVTVPEDWDINQARGRVEEKGAKKSLFEEQGIAGRRQRTDEQKRSFVKWLINAARTNIWKDNPEDMRASPTLKQFIRTAISDVLKGNKVKPEKVSISKTQKLVVKKTTVTLNEAAKKVIKAAKAQKFARPKVRKPKSVSLDRGAKLPPTLPVNIANLESLLRAGLQEQIRKNMGTGNRRDVLNYRSGRFAQSVNIERLSESRQGMITAFYSYMKYPYATFSKGGRQESPSSRDPKLLISKSIREIASTMVTNRLRAVNV